MNAHHTFGVRIGLWTLALYGLMAIIGILLRGPLVDPSTHPQAFAQAAASPNFATAWLLILLGQVIVLFGYIALYSALASTPAWRIGWWGMVLTLAGSALFLSLTGFMAFAAPVIGRLFLQAQTNVMEVGIAGFFGGPVLSVLYPSGLLGALGAILFAIAIWRSGTLPKGAAIPFALAIIVLAFAPAFSYALELLGAVLAMAAGVWLAAGVRTASR